MSELPDDAQSDDSFSLLNSYLDELHAKRQPNRADLVADHPELRQTLEFLDEIDRLAPPLTDIESPSGKGVHSDFTLTPKLRPGSGTAPVVVPVDSSDFGDYQLINEIGRGGMGVVYKARQKSLDRLVAVKMILASHLASTEQIERFFTEAKAAAKVAHPNIVGIHEIGQQHGQHYFVMEHIEGPSLAELVAQGPLESESAAECVAKVARAIHHLHMQGIVHRDLKPSNILIDSKNEPHVTDFGLAKTLMAASQMTHPGAIVGTPSYMSPEQASGRLDHVGPLSDVYSLGALLYELITGRPPYRESTPLDTLVQVLEAEPRLPSELNRRIPRDLEMICLRCLEKVPEQRYESAAALADDLERFLKGEVIEARPPSILLRVRRWARREPALSTRLSLLALCFTILQINFWLTQNTPDHVDPRVHLKVMCALAVWAVASFGFQRMMTRGLWSEWLRYGWSATDAALLTLVLWLTDTIQSPVVVVYPALIATSGLWFRQRLVWFTTAGCVVGYVGLMADWARRGQRFNEPIFRHIILLVVLVMLGFVVNYQVRRIRALSRYYANRPLP